MTHTTSNDTRTWVDRMFVDYAEGASAPLEVVVHDCSKDSNVGDVDAVPNSIGLLVDFASDTESKHLLRGEHVLVIGGNRRARSGLGKLFVPTSQLQNFIEYLQQLKVSLDADLPSMVEQVRAART